MNSKFYYTVVGMIYGMGLLTISSALGFGFMTVDDFGPVLITGLVFFISGALLFHYDDRVMEKLGVTP